jgi:hypothetical protein
MKQTVFRFGIYSLLLILALSCIQFFVLMDRLNYEVMEVVGYLTILLSMIFVFFGIRYYKNERNNGVLSFGQGLKIGVLIVFFPAIFFGVFDVIYTGVINPHWQTDYTNYYLSHMKATKSPAEFETESKKLRDNMELFGKPHMQFLIMFATVFIIGFIVSIISALALRRKAAIASPIN